jgi:hypothetical protein
MLRARYTRQFGWPRGNRQFKLVVRDVLRDWLRNTIYRDATDNLIFPFRGVDHVELLTALHALNDRELLAIFDEADGWRLRLSVKGKGRIESSAAELASLPLAASERPIRPMLPSRPTKGHVSR